MVDLGSVSPLSLLAPTVLPGGTPADAGGFAALLAASGPAAPGQDSAALGNPLPAALQMAAGGDAVTGTSAPSLTKDPATDPLADPTGLFELAQSIGPPPRTGEPAAALKQADTAALAGVAARPRLLTNTATPAPAEPAATPPQAPAPLARRAKGEATKPMSPEPEDQRDDDEDPGTAGQPVALPAMPEPIALAPPPPKTSKPAGSPGRAPATGILASPIVTAVVPMPTDSGAPVAVPATDPTEPLPNTFTISPQGTISPQRIPQVVIIAPAVGAQPAWAVGPLPAAARVAPTSIPRGEPQPVLPVPAAISPASPGIPAPPQPPPRPQQPVAPPAIAAPDVALRPHPVGTGTSDDRTAPAVSTDASPTAPSLTPAIIPAPLAAPPLASPGASDRPVDLTQPDWPAKMIERIETLHDETGATTARLRLKPEALGRIDVAIRTADDGTLAVTFTADHAATRQLLADAQPELARAAEARGLKLGASSVSTGDWAGTGGGEPQHDRAPPVRPLPLRPAAATGEPRDDTNTDQRIA